MTNHDERPGDDWTPEEHAMLASLARERVPSAELKQRTVDAIHHRVAADKRSSASPARTMLLAAAASLIFVAGAVVGYAAARRSPKPPADTTRTATTTQEVARTASPDTNTQQTRHVVWY